jgi:hypothetical protein
VCKLPLASTRSTTHTKGVHGFQRHMAFVVGPREDKLITKEHGFLLRG